jgi:16S rRNA (cytidine1402-2'-O)-methyltransferase
MSYHQHSKLQKTDYIISLLKAGKDLALASDAGTPGISDPGNKLIEAVVDQLQDEVKIVAIPGPSAITAAASISGLPMDNFLFLGFPPVKNKRKKFFEGVMNATYPVIFYESPYRILKTLNELSLSDAKIVVCRELTKKFETVYRGTAKEVIEKIKQDVQKGEFVVIVKNR